MKRKRTEGPGRCWREAGEPLAHRHGWRTLQYSQRPFPVFVLTSSLISVMQRKWSEGRKMKALTSKTILLVQNWTHKNRWNLSMNYLVLSTYLDHIWSMNVFSSTSIPFRDFFLTETHSHPVWSPWRPGSLCAVNQDSQTCKRCKWTACELMLMSVLHGSTETHKVLYKTHGDNK